MHGKRGQAFLRETLAALDALPEKKLVTDELQAEGSFCTLGAVGRARGVEMGPIDPEDHDTVAATFGIADAMAREIMYYNDEAGPYAETPEARFLRMRDWLIHMIDEPPAPRLPVPHRASA
jgi:hypothetical protein